MRTIVAAPASAIDLSNLGRLFDLAGDGPDVIAEPIEGVRDRYTVAPVVEGAVHVGLTVGPTLAQDVVRMERHPGTAEALLTINDPVVLLVSGDPGAQPAADQVLAVLVRPGECLALLPGIWHSAAMGLRGASRYFWLAGVSDSPESPWEDILGGPVRVTLPEADA